MRNMAEILDHFPESYTSKYPLAEWFDGKIRRLFQGEDFTVSPVNFAAAMRQAAKRRGIELRASVSRGTVTIQAQL